MSTRTELSAVKLALAARAAREGQAQGDAGHPTDVDPIAIVGMACRFPGGADDPESLWTLLDAGTDVVIPVPATRWDPTIVSDDLDAPGKMPAQHAGLLDDIEGFDADVFGIAPREAVRMDPQQRLLLEVTWDALRDAGCRSDYLRGSATGVFVAIYSDDYARNLYNDWETIDAHTASGNSHGVAAGRIAYLLDLRGPALAIDTACSSSLVAVHTACRSLRAGETNMAIVGAASLLISPEQSLSLSKWGMMAPDGRCKAFDASADGWVRGEGAGALVLKRLADALRDGDRVHAVIRGSAINQDGRSAAMTAPNGVAQRAVVRAALENARVSPSRLSYIEAHGTGTAVGDPIELEALIDEIGRTSGAPCLVGTIKANIGHLEAAAGLAGMIKVVLALRHQRIPPHLHFRQLNPLVSLEGTRLRIERDGAPWPTTASPRVAGVSSFGFGGTNAHVIVEEAPTLPEERIDPDAPWLVTLSAHDPVALRAMVDDTASAMERDGVRDVAWTLASHEAMRLRVAVVADTAEDATALLRDAASAPPKPAADERSVVFVCSGHGSAWPQMGRESLRDDAVFAESMRESDAIIQTYAGWSVIDVLQDDALAGRVDDTDVFQPLLVSLQLALADSWMAMGVIPGAVIGHSVGEVSAACIAGALSRQDALHLAVDRGRLMQELASTGSMLAVEGDESVIHEVVALNGTVVIAACNAPGMLTLSGTAEAIARARADLEAHGVTCHAVRVTRAFHSAAIEAASTALGRVCADLAPRATTIPFHSSVTGSRMDGTRLDADYWVRNARQTVQFAGAVEELLAGDVGAMIEISPHPVLLAPLQRVATHVRSSAASPVVMPLVPTWRRGRGERATMLASAGALWCAGVSVDREATFHAPGRRLSLPPYRWQRRRAWAGTALPMGRPRGPGASSDDDTRLPGRMTEVAGLPATVFDAEVHARAEVLREHRVCDQVVVPGTLLLLAVLEAARRGWPADASSETALHLEAVTIERALVIPADGVQHVQILLQAVSPHVASFTISSRASSLNGPALWERHASGQVIRGRVVSMPDDLVDATDAPSRPMAAEALYTALRRGGIDLGPSFRQLHTVSAGEHVATAELVPNGNERPSLMRAAARLDAALHPLVPLVLDDNGHDDVWMPVSYGTVSVMRPDVIARSRVLLRQQVSTTDASTAEAATTNTRIADVHLFDASGKGVGALLGVQVQRSSRAELARRIGAEVAAPVLTLGWIPQPLAAPHRSPPDLTGERWLVFEDAIDGATPIADALEAAGAVALRIDRPISHDQGSMHVIGEAVARATTPSPACTGVVFAWGLSPDVSDADETPAAQIAALAGSALALVRELATRAITPPRGVLLITRGAVHVDGDVTPGSVSSAALTGLRNTAALEHPDLQLRAIDVPMHAMAPVAEIVLAECRVDQAVDVSLPITPRVAYRGGERLVAQLMPAPLPLAPSAPLALRPPSPPTIEAIAPVAFERVPPATGMVEIAVEAAGLNFRDVLGALGMVDLPTPWLGGECAGVVSAVGAGVNHLAIGDRVVAFALGALRTHHVVSADMIAPMPAWMSFAHASVLPVAYLTAYYALVHVARVQPGEHVLVHAAAGGVGIAAVHVARWLGARVIGTAGSPEKRAYLRSIGVSEVFDSRHASFRDALRDATGRGRLHVVLNALSDDFIPASLDVLAANGRFVEIGKRGIWSADAVAQRRPDVAYRVFDLAALPAPDAAMLSDMLRTVIALVGDGVLPPLPTTEFALDACREAFRFMAQARHTGKVTIRMPSRSDAVRGDGTYVVTGAFGALGRGVVETLVQAGARHLMLMGRTAPDASATKWLQALAARGVDARVATLDVADGDAVADALSHARASAPPLRGVVHTAGVNDDGALVTQTAERMRAVVRGKVDGAWHLDRLTRHDPIEFFVLFSSASGVLGWPGQVTYSAANTALDQLARLRWVSGRSAISVQWGVWAGDGMAGRVDASARRFESAGLESLSASEAFPLMMALRTGAGSPLVLRADWRTFAATRPHDRGLTAALVHTAEGGGSRVSGSQAPTVADPTLSLEAEVMHLPLSLRADAVLQAMMRLSARALGLPPSERIDASRPLRDLGLDSLMAVELRNAIGAALHRTLPATLLFEHPSIAALSTYVEGLLKTTTPLDGTSAAPPSAKHVTAADADIAAMSDDEAEAQLLAELASLHSRAR